MSLLLLFGKSAASTGLHPATVNGFMVNGRRTLPSSGPATYNDSFSESVSIADTLASAATFPNTISESVALGYSVTGGMLFVDTHPASITAGDSLALAAILANTFAASIAAGDSLTALATFPNTLAESLTVGFTETDNLNGGGTVYNDTLAAAISAGFSFVEYDNTTRLLLKFDETNGSTTPIDTSSRGWLRTASTGAGAVSSAQGMFGSNSVALGNPGGTKDVTAFVSVTGVNDLFSGGGSTNKQFDIWYRPSTANSHTMFSVGLNNSDYLVLYYSSSVTYATYNDDYDTAGIKAQASAAGAITANVWAHYRVSIVGDTLRFGKDGTEKGSVTLGQNVWRGQNPAGWSPIVPNNVRVGRGPTKWDGAGYDFLVAQGYADTLVITEGAGVWTGGAYTVPTFEPAGAWRHESDNWAANPMDVGVGFSLSNITQTLVASFTQSVTVDFTLAATGGSNQYNETLAEHIQPGVTLGQNNWVINASLSMALTLVDSLLGSKAYSDTHSASVALAQSNLAGNVLNAAIAAQIATADGYLCKQTFVETLAEAVLLAKTMGSAQIMLASVGESLAFKATFYTFDESTLIEHVHIYTQTDKVYSQFSRVVTASEYTETEIHTILETIKPKTVH